ncbi:hypothetical protein BC826DRAFT_1088955 [Russula brevipes]|nr:hypothetical protein BC826DRAFT_1088955 [Russula brevipes]
MALSDLSIPSISISFALPDDPPVEPFSPFDIQCPSPPTQEDGYRPSLLSPPPVVSPRFSRQPSPLRPQDTFPVAKGLDRGRFEALLASTRERNANAKKEPDLRKELAMKAHKSKQMERRALFLSKVHAPPSPTATGLPTTPPESPAIFHYSLPSPGLDSPLTVFESLQQNDPSGPVQHPSVQPWVEQVQYRQPKSASARLPSLEQITARLSSHGHSATARDEYHRPPIPLPTFLRSPSRTKPARTTDGQKKIESEIAPPIPEEGERYIPLARPTLQAMATGVPRSSGSSLTDLTEANLNALNSRTLTGRDMMSKLKRRTSVLPSADDAGSRSMDEDERRARRISAPAELPKRERGGFAHPILALPGAF